MIISYVLCERTKQKISLDLVVKTRQQVNESDLLCVEREAEEDRETQKGI